MMAAGPGPHRPTLVIETAKRILVTGLLGAAVVLLTAAPAAAKSCGQKVVDDWWAHGTVKGSYPIDCYRDALNLLPDDASTYSSAPDEIRRALAVAVKKERQPPPPPPQDENPPPPPPAAGNQPPPPAPSNGTGNGSGSGGGKHAGGASQSGQNQQTTTEAATQSTTEAAGQATTEAAGGGPIATDPGSGSGGGSGSSGGGSAQGVLDKIGPDSADGLPLPLLIVAGLAILLLAAGSAGLIARRFQARKVRTPVVPPRQPRS
jgi:hypothetical protein